MHARPRQPAHQATTAQVQALYPFVADSGLGGAGIYLGRDVYGGNFCYDPFVWYERGLISGPNMLIVGELGQRKSALVKSLVYRASVYGYQAWIIDPKGEYRSLAQALGVTPIRLQPDGQVRLNPLDRAISGEQQLGLIEAVTGILLGRPLTPDEQAALGAAHAQLNATTPAPVLADLVAALLHPSREAAKELATTTTGLAAASRQAALALRRLAHGPLAGMLDAPTTTGVDLDAPLVVLDISALLVAGEELVSILMLITAGWLQAAWTATTHARQIVVLDEAWRVLADLTAARWLRATWKLARAQGVSMVAVMHRLADLSAAGHAGSEQVALVAGLLADSETRVIFRQPPGEAAALAALLGLSAAEVDYIVNQLTPGQACWQVGRTLSVVQHLISPAEHAIVDTDQRMRGPDLTAAGSSATRPPPVRPAGDPPPTSASSPGGPTGET